MLTTDNLRFLKNDLIPIFRSIRFDRKYINYKKDVIQLLLDFGKYGALDTDSQLDILNRSKSLLGSMISINPGFAKYQPILDDVIALTSQENYVPRVQTFNDSQPALVRIKINQQVISTTEVVSNIPSGVYDFQGTNFTSTQELETMLNSTLGKEFFFREYTNNPGEYLLWHTPQTSSPIRVITLTLN